MPTDPLGINDVDVPCEVAAELSNSLIALGFDQGAPIYRATPQESLAWVFKNIVDGFYGKGFLQGDGVHCEQVHLAFRRRDKRYGPYSVTMMLELIQAIHRPGAAQANPHEPTCPYLERFSWPDWYFRGLLRSPRPLVQSPGLSPSDDDRPCHFHGYIQAKPGEQEPDWPHGMIIQITRSTGEANTGASLKWGTGVPTHPAE